MRALRNLLALGMLAALHACGGSNPGPGPGPTPIPEVVSYAGTWSGTYRVTSCTNSGFFADTGFCGEVLNTTAAVTFTFAQTASAVTGTFQLGTIAFPNISASVAADGSLTFSSSVTTGAFPIDASWVLRRPTTTTLTGQTHQVWKATGVSGEGVLDGEIVGVTKSAAVTR